MSCSSEDSVRRKLGKRDEANGGAWLGSHLDVYVAPILGPPAALPAPA